MLGDDLPLHNNKGEKRKRKMDRNGEKKGGVMNEWLITMPARTTSFLAFAQEQRGIIKQQQPDITFDELATLLSTKWKELPESEKKVSFYVSPFFLLSLLFSNPFNSPHFILLLPLFLPSISLFPCTYTLL
jgi:hypothetical protein